jgi:hypothetical protein
MVDLYITGHKDAHPVAMKLAKHVVIAAIQPEPRIVTANLVQRCYPYGRSGVEGEGR